MKYFTLIAMVMLRLQVYSQEVEIISRGPVFDKPQYQQFIYIAEGTDVPPQTFVAKIKATGSLKDVTKLCQAIRKEAQSLGANSYKFEGFTKTDDSRGELILSVYQNGDSFFDSNFGNIPKNKIFVFGSSNLAGGKSQNFKLQGVKQELGAGKYLEYEIAAGEEVKVNKGGITGMTLWLSRTKYEYSHFLNFSGIGLNGASVTPMGGVGVSIDTGTIHEIEPNLALLLLRIYTKQ